MTTEAERVEVQTDNLGNGRVVLPNTDSEAIEHVIASGGIVAIHQVGKDTVIRVATPLENANVEISFRRTR